MSVTTNRDSADPVIGHYVPFRTGERGWNGSPVGTFAVDAQTTGDATGGTLDLNILMQRDMFGFHPLFVPTFISTRDNLATAEVVIVGYQGGGNDRLLATFREAVLPLAGASGLNVGRLTQGNIIIDPSSLVAAGVLTASWSSNVDTKAYHFHIMCTVFDGQLLAREGQVHELLGGLS